MAFLFGKSKSKNEDTKPGNGSTVAEPPTASMSATNAGSGATPAGTAATRATWAAETMSDKQELAPQEAQRRAAISKQLAAAFGEMVTLMMRSGTDRKRPIADLAWMIAPGIQTGQFAIADAQSKTNGSVTPVGAIMWAKVSAEVDQKLTTSQDKPPHLEPKDWRSGDIPWIVIAIGDNRVVAGLIHRITKEVFKGTAPKIRSRDKDGNIVGSRIELPKTDGERATN